eukprot:scaffold113436_cov20-Tisochrysis_lutea.AAC.1
MLLVKRGGGPRRVGGLGRTKKGRKGGRGNAFVPGACHVGPEPHGCHPLKDVPLAHLHHLFRCAWRGLTKGAGPALKDEQVVIHGTHGMKASNLSKQGSTEAVGQDHTF